MIVLKRTVKKIISVLLCLIMSFSVSVPAFAAYNYPEGVDGTKAYNGAYKTDEVLKNAISYLGSKSLKEILYETIITDEALSGILTAFYKGIEQNSEDIKSLNIDISPISVGHYLSSFPAVEAKLLAYSSWSQVDLTGVSWGVSDKNGFAIAVSAMFGPFNNLLYTLLCSGKYPMGLVSLQGDDGYKNAVMGLLSALGCTEIASAEQFKAQAGENMYTMVQNIVFSLFSLLDSVSQSPVVRLSQVLPNLAYYIKDGGFNTALETLVSPLKVKLLNLIPILDGSKLISFIENPEESTSTITENPTDAINSLLEPEGLKVANIDLELLASCGTNENGYIKADIGSASAVIFTWLIDTLKLNGEAVTKLIKEGGSSFDASAVINAVLSVESGKLYSSFIEVMTQTAAVHYAFEWSKPEFSETTVSYTQNLGQDKFQRVLEGMDELVNDFIKESKEASSLQEILKKEIYSPQIVSKLYTMIYKELSKEELSSALSIIGVDITPKGVAKHIDLEFYKVKTLLANASSWDEIKEESFDWGFKKGDSKKFEKAAICAVKPFESILGVLLLSKKMNVFGLDIYGSNGYNNGIIPILEALGCDENLIMTEQQLAVTTKEGEICERLLHPIFSLVERVIDRPVYELCQLLPNIIFFIKSGNLMNCVQNILLPIENILSKFGVTFNALGLNMEEIKNIDIIDTVSKDAVNLLSDEIKIDEPNLSLIGTLGKLTEYQSKSTKSDGTAMTLYKVQSEPTAVIITILRYLIETLTKEENSKLLSSVMPSGDSQEGADAMFAQFSSGITEQLSSMTTDETVEWLYKLFFRERAVSNTAGKEEYIPTVIYKASPKVNFEIASPLIIVLVIAVIILITNRGKLKDFVEKRKKENKLSAREV